MKNSTATHVLGLLLAAAATASAASASAFGGSAVPAEHHHAAMQASAGGGSLVGDGHAATAGAGAFGGSGVPEQKVFQASAGGGSLVRDSHGAYSHDMLKAHVHGKEGGVRQGLLHPLPHYLVGFLAWSYEYGIEWAGLEDALHSLENYARSDDKIALHNAGDASFTLGHNAYSHMSWQEFRDHFGIGKDMVLSPSDRLDFEARPRGEKVAAPMLRGEALPDEVDWVAKGGVTDVKNQGSCGSCWSFSTTGSMEGAHFIKTGELAVLSEQELVDCDTYDMGCDGGLMDYSFHWIQQNGGICSETDYPYTAEGDECKKTTCDTVPGTMVDKWIDVDHDSEEALMAAVAQQPVSIAIEADEMSFQLYSGGVLTANCGTNLDHGVLLVGYGVSEEGVKYWKVKNSWGADWGADGYILLERDAPEVGGECGILMQASYPVLA